MAEKQNKVQFLLKHDKIVNYKEKKTTEAHCKVKNNFPNLRKYNNKPKSF